MNETLKNLCSKYSLSDEATSEFNFLFEKEIIKVFNNMSLEIDNKTHIKNKVSSSNDNICAGKKNDGNSCTFKSKENGYCARHNPDKTSDKKTSPSKPRVKKDSKKECHAIIKKTGKQCIQTATIKPDGSDFYYCKRHSEKWTDFENDVEHKLISSEEDDNLSINE